MRFRDTHTIRQYTADHGNSRTIHTTHTTHTRHTRLFVPLSAWPRVRGRRQRSEHDCTPHTYTHTYTHIHTRTLTRDTHTTHRESTPTHILHTQTHTLHTHTHTHTHYTHTHIHTFTHRTHYTHTHTACRVQKINRSQWPQNQHQSFIHGPTQHYQGES